VNVCWKSGETAASLKTRREVLSTGCGKKVSPKEFMVILFAISRNFDTKFFTFIAGTW